MADFLYRSVTGDGAADGTAWLWDFALGKFLQLTSEPVLGALKARGYVLRYIIDNSYPPLTLLTGPMTFFADWFHAAGFVYVCPECIAAELMKADGHGGKKFLDLLPRYIDEAIDVTAKLLQKVRTDGLHCILIETGGRDEMITKAMEDLGRPGSVYITRKEAPGPGTNIAISALPWFPEH